MDWFGLNDKTGIDIGAGSVKVVRITRGKRPKLVSAAIVELPPDQAGAALVPELVHLRAAKKIGARNVVTLMPGKDLTVRSLSLPKMPVAELREAVRWEAKRHISFPLESSLVEYLISGENQEGVAGKYDILMVAAENAKVVEHLAPLRDAAITVSAVDSNALALRNVLRTRDRPLEGNLLVVDIGAGKTEIDIFNSGVLRFSRCLETGGFDMTRQLAEGLGLTLKDAEALKCSADAMVPPDRDNAAALVRSRLDALLMEIRRSVEYYRTTFREQGVREAILTGGASLMKGTAAYCAEALGFPVAIDDPFAGLACTDALREEFGPLAPRFSAAVGLALRED